MNKIALVIGINNYDNFEKLDKCIKDAKAIHEFLEIAGFEVILLLDPKQNDLEENIKIYKSKIKNDTVAVFYYAGHGLQLERYNFMVSVDSEIKTVNDIPYNSTNLSILFSDLTEDLKFTHIIILDACRKNPFNTGMIETIPGIEKKALKRGTIIAYAASPGSPSVERKEDDNGVFTQHLLKNLHISNISIEQVLKNTRTEVLLYTDNKQLAWEETSLYGEHFTFLEKDETILEFQEIIDEFLESDDNLLLPRVQPFLQLKYFHALTLEHLHFALTIIKIAFEDEEEGRVKATIDIDYLTDKLIDTIYPLFQIRIINEDNCENIYADSIFDEIEIIKEINYGYNDVLTVDDAFPHFMINHVSYDGKEGLFSSFLSFENGKHFIKPMLYLKNDILEIFCFQTLYDDEAIKFLHKLVDLRKPFEKAPPNLMGSIKSANINSSEDLMDFFKDDFDDDKKPS